MAWFKLYAGLSGGFGGSTYQGTFEFETEQEASDAARQMAREDYESYEGLHGILSYDDCYEEAFNDIVHEEGDALPEETAALAEEYYEDAVDSWIAYHVEPATGPEDGDDE